MNYFDTLSKEIEGMAKGFIQLLPSLAIAVLVLVATWIMARVVVRIIGRVTQRANLRTDLQQLTETITKLAVWIVGALIAMTVAIPSFTPAGAFASLGVGALAIGFAFQDIFENFLAGVLIMLREKMNIGDSIKCNGLTGKVERITLRETYVRQFSGELTVMPNSMLFKNPVEILTDQHLRRNEVIVGVSYDTDLDQARAIIESALQTVEAIDAEKGTVVFAQAFGASSIDFLVQWWNDTSIQDLRLTRSQVIFAVKAALDNAGIEIPFPYVTNTFKEPLRMERPKALEQHGAA